MSFTGWGIPLISAEEFTPTDIAGLVAWYDFSDISTLWQDAARSSAITTNGQTILGVTDKSGSGFHLSAVTNGPTYTTGAQNGLSVARFDGANDELLTSSNVVSQPDTIFLVGKKNDTTDIEHLCDGADATHRQVIGIVTNKFALHAGVTLDSGVAVDTTARVFCGVCNGASSKLFLSGGTPASGDAGTQVLSSGLNFGRDQSSGGPWTAMDLDEVLIYNSSLSNPNLNLAGNYLESKWALTWTDV